jgi:hypothetical protein
MLPAPFSDVGAELRMKLAQVCRDRAKIRVHLVAVPPYGHRPPPPSAGPPGLTGERRRTRPSCLSVRGGGSLASSERVAAQFTQTFAVEYAAAL